MRLGYVPGVLNLIRYYHFIRVKRGANYELYTDFYSSIPIQNVG